MATFTSPSQLNSFLNKKLVNVIDYLTERIQNQLRHNIDEYTYQFDYFPNREYLDENSGWAMPSFEFRDSFYRTKAKNIAEKITGWVIHDAMSMSPPSDRHPYLHGNFDKGIDRRRELASLLNVSGLDTENDFGGKERRPFFDITIKWLENNFDSLVRQAFAKVGLNII